MFFLAFQRIHFCKTKETSFVCVKKRKTECTRNSPSLYPDPQSTCPLHHSHLALCPGRLDLAPVAFGFQVDLANSRRLKGRRRETRALIPLAVSQPIVPVHSAQCWGGPALLCPFRYRDGNGPSPWLLSVASLSWFSHPAHFMVNKPFMTPPAPPPTTTPFEHTIICFPDPGRWKNCSKESSKY